MLVSPVEAIDPDYRQALREKHRRLQGKLCVVPLSLFCVFNYDLPQVHITSKDILSSAIQQKWNNIFETKTSLRGDSRIIQYNFLIQMQLERHGIEPITEQDNQVS